MLAGPAEEMAAFMIAHLAEGAHLQLDAHRNTRLLEEATARQMQATQYTYHPEIAGQAFGFIEGLSAYGPHSLSHEGWSGERTDSLLYLLPEENVGLYIVQNTDDDHALIRHVRDQLYQRYYPADEAAQAQAADLAPPPDLDRRAAAYTGVYRYGEYWHTSVFKLLILEWADYPRVTAPGDGTLEVQFAEGQDPFQYVQIDGDLFGLVNYPESGSRRLVFLRDDGGQVSGFSFDTAVHYEKVPWHGRLWLHKALFAFFAAAFVAGVAVAGLALWRSRRQRLLLALAAVTGLLNVLAMATTFALMGLDLEQQMAILAYDPNPLPVVAAAVALLLASGLAAVTLVLAVPVWRKRAWPAWGRWLYTAFAVVAVAFIPFLSHWKLLGFRW
jgi:hypothetical protein